VEVVGSEHNPERRLRVQPAPERILRCGRCDAPVDAVQRYCIVCGAHQLHVEDPAARYMSTLAAQQRASRDARRDSRATLTLGRALIVACLPVALLLGALAGRASTSGDAAVVAALRARSAPAVLSTPAASRTSSAIRRHPGTPRQPPAHRATRTPSATSARTVRRIQKLTGSSYLKAQQGLPNQVSVP